MFHQKPPSAGNFLSLKSGDIITLDVPNRKLNINVTDEEFAERKKRFHFLPSMANRGYVKLYIDHVQQAHLGADLDFLIGGSGSTVVRDSH